MTFKIMLWSPAVEELFNIDSPVDPENLHFALFTLVFSLRFYHSKLQKTVSCDYIKCII